MTVSVDSDTFAFNLSAPVVPTIEKEGEDKTISGDGSPVITDIGNNITSLRNSSITLRCPSSGVPKPVTTWTKDGTDVVGMKGHEIQPDGSLLIRQALVGGMYTCTVASVAGTDSDSSVVIVTGEILRQRSSSSCHRSTALLGEQI